MRNVQDSNRSVDLPRLIARLDDQAREIAQLRAELALQFTRIAQIQAVLDLGAALQYRRELVTVLTPPRAAGSGGRYTATGRRGEQRHRFPVK